MEFENRMLCADAVRAGVVPPPDGERLNDCINALQKANETMALCLAYFEDAIETFNTDMIECVDMLAKTRAIITDAIRKGQMYGPYNTD